MKDKKGLIFKKMVLCLGVIFALGVAVWTGNPNPDEGPNEKDDLPFIVCTEIGVM